MNLFEIEIGRSYKCDRKDGQYFGTVKEKRDGCIGVELGNKVGTAAPVAVGPTGDCLAGPGACSSLVTLPT
jgi:hypothetical protein